MAVRTLFIMVVFVRRGIIINKIGENPVLYIDKKHFFDQNSDKMKNFRCFFGCNIWTFGPLTRPRRPQTDLFLLSLSSLGKTGSKWYVTCHVNSKYLQIYSVWKDFVQIWLRATHFRGFSRFFRDFHIRLTSRYSFSDSSYNSASIDIQQAYVLTHSLEARSMSCSWWRH